MSETIDGTPTWKACIPWLVDSIQRGNLESTVKATKTLMELAEIVDNMNARAEDNEDE